MLVGCPGQSSRMKSGGFDVVAVIVVEDAGVGREIHQVPIGARTGVDSPAGLDPLVADGAAVNHVARGIW